MKSSQHADGERDDTVSIDDTGSDDDTGSIDETESGDDGEADDTTLLATLDDDEISPSADDALSAPGAGAQSTS